MGLAAQQGGPWVNANLVTGDPESVTTPRTGIKRRLSKEYT